jgi:hypothetical protein
MDATIIEVAFHDDVMDAAIMRDPNGRDQIARSTLQGAVQYFSLYGSPVVANTNLPSAPTNVRVVSNASGVVTLNWAAGTSSPASVYGNAATGYKVYASVDGYGFDGGRAVAGVGTTTLTITGLDANTTYYFKVTATNAGGESTGTEVVAALPSGGTKQVLIVNGFDRYDRTQNFRYAYLGGQVDRVWPRYNNSHDYVVQVATAIQASKPGVHVATTSNEAIISGTINLTDYNTVIWISGTESTDDHTFDATEQTKITTFINAGGNLFLSGSEIGWDLDQQNHGRTFYESTLKANYVSDDAGTYTATADVSGIFAGMSSFVFSNGTAFSQLDSQMYDVAFPDVIAPQAGAVSALTYSGGTGGTAAIQVPGTGGRGNLVMFAFPFEAMTNASRRQNAVGNILSFLGGEIAIETCINGQDADSGPGPILIPGSTASLTYIVTNPGIVSLSSVSVLDDNGTPGNAADDFNATYSSGDTNSNGQLDVGETWTYTASRTVVAGQTTRSGKAVGTANSTTVNSSDAANYFGSVPGIGIETRVSLLDADSAPGPTLAAGGNATFVYLLTNTGNIILSNVAVTDNNGTPGNGADDFNPAFAGGDSNSNNLLDVGETWTFSATRTVVAGQYSSVSTTTAEDSIGQPANSTDPVNYFGSAPAINLQTSVNGDDADSPPGPSFAAGSSVTFEYVLTNTGNVPLANAMITDDNGTPGDVGDNFNPTYLSGDSNSNNLLDLGETWTFTALRTVYSGQYTHTSSAIGLDSVNQIPIAADLTSYFVPANADFNSDTVVDAGDYVMWRKNSGIASGAALSQGDANGDGMVDGIDYDFWRAQFSTLIDAGGGTGAGAASGTGTEQSTAAASLLVADSIFIADVAVTAAEASQSHAVDTVADSVFAQLRAGANERRISQRGGAARRMATHDLSPDWSTLLSILADHKSRRDKVEAIESADENSTAVVENSCVEDLLSSPHSGAVSSQKWGLAGL